jgi:hypothetical protein
MIGMTNNRTAFTVVSIAGIIVAGSVLFFMARGVPVQPAEAGSDTASESKLDINAICNGALAYMTFPDGAAAEAFVAECEAGKHPEVIEKYKIDLNLGAGAQI